MAFNVSTGGPSEEEKKDVGESEGDGGLRRIRTFRSDARRFIREKKPSLISIAARRIDREKIAPQSEREERAGKKLIFYGALAVLLVGLGLAAFFYFGRAEPQEVVARPPSPLVAAEDDRTINIQEKDRSSLILGIQDSLNENRPRKNLLNILILEEDRAGNKDFLRNTGELFETLRIAPPLKIVQSSGGRFLLGVFSGELRGKNNLVLVFDVTSYENAFAGMLEWENSVVRDLAVILPRHLNIDTGNNVFVDVVANNQDARFIPNKDGEPILFYSIFSRKIVVLTTSEESLKEIINRLILSLPV